MQSVCENSTSLFGLNAHCAYLLVTLFPVLVGVAGSAAGKKDLVSLGHILWYLQECRQIQ